MKKILFALMVLMAASCHNNSIADIFKKEPDYNEATNNLVLSTLSGKMVSMDKTTMGDGVQYRFYFKDAMFGIVHYEAKEYSQKEHWTYGMVMKDGTDIMIESPLNLPVHKIAPETYQKLRELCNY